MRRSKELFKANIDPHPNGYPPFALLIFVLIFGICMFYYSIVETPVSKPSIELWGVVFLAVLILEMILIQIRKPKERIILVEESDGLSVEIWDAQELVDSQPISQVKYWWNYNFGGNFRDDDQYSNNSDLTGTGAANGLYLYVQINGKDKAPIHLKEMEGNWASTPHWNYSLENLRDRETEVTRCTDLKKIVKVLQAYGF
ncbi:MAG: hypothetical protein AAFP19_18045 [Bacteroidota bacterium]